MFERDAKLRCWVLAGIWSIGELIDAALAAAPDRRRQFRVIEGGREQPISSEVRVRGPTGDTSQFPYGFQP
jgi:hypothetical protein